MTKATPEAMNKPKPLEWGETPWDNLTKKQLLHEVRRMYSALEQVTGALQIAKGPGDGGSFYGPEGSAGRAIADANTILLPLQRKYPKGQIYFSFFRYANDLLFPKSRANWRWQVCPKCGAMLGNRDNEMRPCANCKVEMRKMSWKDLKPKRP